MKSRGRWNLVADEICWRARVFVRVCRPEGTRQAPAGPLWPRLSRFWAQSRIFFRRHGAANGAPRRAALAPAAVPLSAGPPRHASRPPAGGRRAAKARPRAKRSLEGQKKARFLGMICRQEKVRHTAAARDPSWRISAPRAAPMLRCNIAMLQRNIAIVHRKYIFCGAL